MNKEQLAVLKAYEAVNELLQNLYDAGDTEDAEGYARGDVLKVEHALADLNKAFELGK